MGLTKFKLNIQQFAGMGTTVSDEAKQDKYATNIKTAYGLATDEERMRILSYMQKNQSPGHERFAFYTSGELGGDGTVTGGVNDTGSQTTATDKTGVSVKDFYKAVFAVPTKTEVPFYRDEDDDNTTSLNLESGLIRGQVAQLCNLNIAKILKPLKDLCTASKGSRTYQYQKKDGSMETVNYSTNWGETHEYGDQAKTFYELEDQFFQMLAEMEALSVGRDNNCQIALFFGTTTNGVLKQFDRTSHRDYITTADFEAKDGRKLAIKKFDVAEMVPINSFDKNVGKNYIVGVLSDAMGYDAVEGVKTVRKVLEEKGSIFYNATVKDTATIVDGKGIFIFEYNGKIGSRTPVAP